MKNLHKASRSAIAVALALVFALELVASVPFVTVADAAGATEDSIGSYNYIFTNPYANVNWDTWGSYRGATHVHTHTSDGSEDINEMIEKYYELGYDAMAITDHGTVNYGWTNSPSRHTIFDYQFFVHSNPTGISQARYNQITTGVGRDGRGMTEVPLGIELNGASTSKCHINGFYADAGDGDMEMDATWPSDAIAKNHNAGGITHINHVGEWSGGNDNVGVYDASFIQRFANIFLTYSSCVGMELVNTADSRTKNDRYLYDQTLMLLAPQGRNIYGFCEDDSHEFSDCGRNDQVYMMPSNTAANIRTCMETGAFFACSKNARQANELAGATASSSEPYPKVSRLTIDEAKDQIVINCQYATKIRLVANGTVIETYDVNASGDTVTFDLNAYENKIGSYVRVYLTGAGGICFMQPLLLTRQAYTNSTVQFLLPSIDTTLTVKDSSNNTVTPVNSDHYYVLPAGTYTYTASRYGFLTKNETFTVTQQQISSGAQTKITITLSTDPNADITYFYVPETIYLNTSDRQSFQYYIDRAVGVDGALSTSPSKTSGNIYFRSEKATSITSISVMPMTGPSLPSVSITNTSSPNNVLSTTVTAGRFALALDPSTGCILRWTVTYVVDGVSLEAYAYSYVFAPLTGVSSSVAAGGSAETSWASGWMHSTMTCTGAVWLTGVHSVSGGIASYKFAPNAGFTLSGANGMGGACITGVGANYSSGTSNGGSYTANAVGGTGTLTIDTSRYSNLKQIPNLQTGLDMLYADQTDGGGADNRNQTLSYGSTLLYSLSVDNLTSIADGTRLFSSDNSDPAKDIDQPINADLTSLAFTGTICGGKSDRYDTVNGTVFLALNYVNKSSLRALYNTAVGDARQSVWYASGFDAYLNALQAAGAALGNPKATQAECNTAATNLTNAINALVLATSTATVRHCYIDRVSHELKTIDSETYTYTMSTVISSASSEFTGYNYLGTWTRYVNTSTQNMTGTTQSDVIYKASALNIVWVYMYEQDDFDVTYNAGINNYIFSLDNTYLKAYYNSTYTLPATLLTQTGYIFSGWMLDIDSSIHQPQDSFSWTYTRGGAFTAVWIPKTYNVTYTLSAECDAYTPLGLGDVPVETTVEYNGNYDPPVNYPTRTGYTFRSWYVNGDTTLEYAGGGTLVWTTDGNMEFTANWTANTYDASFAVNGGNAFTPTGGTGASITYDQNYTLPTNEPTREHYEFVNWVFSGNGNTYNPGDTFMWNYGDGTFTAQWSDTDYSVSYNVNGGNTYVPAQGTVFTLNYGDTYTLPANIPTKSHYNFTGWLFSGNNQVYQAGDTFTWNFTNGSFTAQWEDTDYYVSFASDGDAYTPTGGTGAEVHYGATYTLPTNVPTKQYRIFDGWTFSGNTTKYAAGATLTWNYENGSFTATWKDIDYDVTYDLDDGNFTPSGGSGALAQYGRSYTLPANRPTKVNNDFVGWLYSGDGEIYQAGESLTWVCEDGSFTAQWSNTSYPVTYDLNGGNTSYVQQGGTGAIANFGSTYILPSNEPTREHFTFAGWKLSENDLVYQPGGSFTWNYGAGTFTAQWDDVEYDVTFNTNDGDAYLHQGGTGLLVHYGDTYTLPSNAPTRTHYTFEGWRFSGDGEIYQANDTLTWNYEDGSFTAQWDDVYYNVSFAVNGGNPYTPAQGSETSVIFGDTYTLPSNKPTRDYYDFTGWRFSGDSAIYQAGDTVDWNYTNGTFTAQWTLTVYDVTYDVNDGAPYTPITGTAMTITYGAGYTLPINPPSRSHYDFTGWLYSGNNTVYQPNASLTWVCGDGTFTAQWELTDYTITFNSNGGDTYTPPMGTPTTIHYGETIVLPTTVPTKDNNDFGGWYFSGDQKIYLAGATVLWNCDNGTFTAQWGDTDYTVTLDVNGGDAFTPTSATIHYGNTYTLPANAPTRSYYDFTGWRFSENSTVYDAGDAITWNYADGTFTAQWTLKSYSVSYSVGIGATFTPSGTSTTVIYGDTYKLPTNEPMREHYEFDGWSFSENANVYQPGSTLTWNYENATFTARWTQVDYTAAFSVNGGNSYTPTGGTGTTVNFGDTYVLPTNSPTRAHYNFTGWLFNGNGQVYQPGASFTWNFTNEGFAAQWTLKVYNVTYNINGGSTYTPQNSSGNTATFGSTYTLPSNAPEKPHAEFRGWLYSGNGQIYQTGANITWSSADGSFTAQWSDNDYTVSFDINGGNTYTPTGGTGASVSYAATYTLPTNEPTKYYSRFDGWLFSGDGEIYDAGDELTWNYADGTFTAQWSYLNYTATFNINGGSTYTPTGGSGTSIVYGGSFTLPTNNPSRAHYTFDGWRFSENLSVYQAGDSFTWSFTDGTFTAQWSKVNYTVSYESNGGNVYSPLDGTGSVVNYGDTYTLPSNLPVKAHCNFEGWRFSGNSQTYAAGSAITWNFTNGTFTAQWSDTQYTASFVSSGDGEFTPVGGTGAAVTYGATYTLPTNYPTKNRFDFAGWLFSGNSIVYDSGDTFTWNYESGTFTAQWTNTNYPVTFNTAGGDSYSPMGGTGLRAVFGAGYKLPTNEPTKDYCTFAGWKYSADNMVYEPGETITWNSEQGMFTAQWTYRSYSVTYQTNGGNTYTPSGVSLTATYMNTYTLPTNKPTRQYYVFAGWLYSGDGDVYAAGESFTWSAGSGTLTAQWTKAVYTVSYLANGGDDYTPEQGTLLQASYGEVYSLPSNEPTKAHCTFTGWLYSGNSNVYHSGDSIVWSGANGTFTAQWVDTQYAVTYNTNGGNSYSPTGSSGVTTTYGSTYNLPSNEPTRTHYTFAGWLFSGDNEVYRANGDLVWNYEAGTFTAQWTSVDYTVLFATNGGDEYTPAQGTELTVNYGEQYTLPSNAPTRAHYDFNGWLYSGNSTVYQPSATLVWITTNGTFTAQWSKTVYTVVYDSEGGNTFTPANGTGLSVQYGDTYTLPTNVPTKENCEFSGWLFSESDDGTLYAPGSSFTWNYTNGEFSALWGDAEYNVVYNVNGGATYSPVGGTGTTVIYGASYVLPTNVPTRTNYDFDGWLFSGDNALYQAGATITWNYTLEDFTAQWSKTDYTVDFSLFGGDAFTPTGGTGTTVNYGDMYVLPTNEPTKAYCDFGGWRFSGDSLIYQAGDRFTWNYTNGSFSAQWTDTDYAVSFDVNGGNEYTPVGGTGAAVNYGELYTLPTNAPVKANYDFLGWLFSENSRIYQTSDSFEWSCTTGTFTAQWAKTDYTAYFVISGGNAYTPVGGTGATVNYGDTYTLPSNEPTRDYYTFEGWLFSGDDAVYAPSARFTWESGNGTFTAQWEKIDYEVTYDVAGGNTYNAAAPSTVNYGDTYTLPINTPYKNHCTFSAWLFSGDNHLYNPGDTVVWSYGDGTFTAQWNDNAYTATFITDGGNAFTPTGGTGTSVNYGDEYTLPTNRPTKQYNVFAGWRFSGDNAVHQPGEVIVWNSANGTFIAQWNPINYVVTYDAAGGNTYVPVGGSGIIAHYGMRYILPTNEPTKLGYRFAGWQFSEDATDDVYEPGDSIDWNYTTGIFTAEWTLANHTITFKGKYNYIIRQVLAPVGGTVSIPSPQGLIGYDFAGWDIDVNDDEYRYSYENIVVNAIYRVSDSMHPLTVNGEVFEYHQYDIATVTTPQYNERDEMFLYWVDENGEIASYNRTYKFYVHKLTTLTAVYGNTPVQNRLAGRITSFEYNSYYQWLSVYMERSISADYELMQFGVLITDDAAYGTSPGSFVLTEEGGAPVGVEKSTALNTTNRNGLYTLSFGNLGNYAGTIYVRSYMKVNNGADIMYVYSDIKTYANIYSQLASVEPQPELLEAEDSQLQDIGDVSEPLIIEASPTEDKTLAAAVNETQDVQPDLGESVVMLRDKTSRD